MGVILDEATSSKGDTHFQSEVEPTPQGPLCLGAFVAQIIERKAHTFP